MEGDTAMFERILRKIEDIFKNDPELKEFSFIPVGGNLKNKSPVIYENHNIGLESWCIKYIYKYAYAELFEYRKLSTRKKQIFQRQGNLNHLLMGALLINPDMASFWNMKRELVRDEVLSIDQELLFTKVVLSFKSKSNDTFAYRRWLVQRALAKIPETNVQSFESLVDNEMAVCEMAAARSENNYHAWTHRSWCLNLVQNRFGIGSVLVRELQWSYDWLTTHISEHTSYHYRQIVFKLLKNYGRGVTLPEWFYSTMLVGLQLPQNDPKKILSVLFGKEKDFESEDDMNRFFNYTCLLMYDLLHTTPASIAVFHDHESMWYHRRYLTYHLVELCYEYHDIVFNRNGFKMDEKIPLGSNLVDLIEMEFNDGLKKPKILRSQPNKVETSFIYKILRKLETEFMESASSVLDIHYARRHAKWLKIVVGMEQG